MTKHTQSIIIFGLAIPCILILGLIGGALSAQGSIKEKRQTKSSAFEEYQRTSTERQIIDTKLGKDDRREKVAFWEEQLNEELIQAVTRNLNKITAGYDETQLRRTSFSRPSGASQLAGSVESKYNRLVLGFEGGFGPMQETMAELEILMPHLTLESFKATPSTDRSRDPFLTFEVVYLAWAPLDA